MTPLDAEWKKITPEHLWPAMEHVRESFDTRWWKCSRITEVLCHAALHSASSPKKSVSDYLAVFDDYRSLLGPRVTRDYDGFLRLGTPPALFRAFFDLLYEGIKVAIREQFDCTLSIGLAQWHSLDSHPVDWASLHLDLLVRRKDRLVERWIKEVCDTHELPEPDLIPSQFEEIVFWNTLNLAE